MQNCLLSLKILIIEYNRFEADLLEAAVTTERHEATVTLDPAEACRMVEEAYRSNQPFDLVFMEFMLPETTGIDVCRKLKQIDPSLTIVLVTADYSAETRLAVAEYGEFAGFINKAEDLSLVRHHLAIAMANKKARLSGEKSEYLRRLKELQKDKAGEETV